LTRAILRHDPNNGVFYWRSEHIGYMKIFAIGLLLIVLFAVGFWKWGRLWSEDTLPTDAALRQQFKGAQQHLFRLQQMVDQDRLQGRVHARYVDAKRLSPERVAEYRRLMKMSGITRLWASDSESTEFLVDAVGMLDVGTYKGFSCSKKEREPVAASLDVSCMPHESKARYCDAFQRLDEDWWLIRYEYR
jgi:hypothetical protein